MCAGWNATFLGTVLFRPLPRDELTQSSKPELVQSSLFMSHQQFIPMLFSMNLETNGNRGPTIILYHQENQVLLDCKQWLLLEELSSWDSSCSLPPHSPPILPHS
jgi:hypothetical protein